MLRSYPSSLLNLLPSPTSPPISGAHCSVLGIQCVNQHLRGFLGAFKTGKWSRKGGFVGFGWVGLGWFCEEGAESREKDRKKGKREGRRPIREADRLAIQGYLPAIYSEGALHGHSYNIISPFL